MRAVRPPFCVRCNKGGKKQAAAIGACRDVSLSGHNCLAIAILRYLFSSHPCRSGILIARMAKDAERIAPTEVAASGCIWNRPDFFLVSKPLPPTLSAKEMSASAGAAPCASHKARAAWELVWYRMHSPTLLRWPHDLRCGIETVQIRKVRRIKSKCQRELWPRG
jgi:hypothetical protein